MQNDTYPANTADPNLVTSGSPAGSPISTPWAREPAPPRPTSWPRSSRATSASTPPRSTNLSAALNYTIDERDVSINQCSAWSLRRTRTRSVAARTARERSTAVYVVPQEWLKQKVDGSSRLPILPQSNTKLTLGYKFDDIDRSNAQVGPSETSNATVGLSSMLNSAVQGRITYDYIDRSGVELLGAVGDARGQHRRSTPRPPAPGTRRP